MSGTKKKSYEIGDNFICFNHTGVFVASIRHASLYAIDERLGIVVVDRVEQRGWYNNISKKSIKKASDLGFVQVSSTKHCASWCSPLPSNLLTSEA